VFNVVLKNIIQSAHSKNSLNAEILFAATSGTRRHLTCKLVFHRKEKNGINTSHNPVERWISS